MTNTELHIIYLSGQTVIPFFLIFFVDVSERMELRSIKTSCLFNKGAILKRERSQTACPIGIPSVVTRSQVLGLSFSDLETTFYYCIHQLNSERFIQANWNCGSLFYKPKCQLLNYNNSQPLVICPGCSFLVGQFTSEIKLQVRSLLEKPRLRIQELHHQ